MITKEVTDHGKMVITELRGDITGQEVMDDFHAMFQLTAKIDPTGFAHLYDMSQVSTISMHENDVRRMTAWG